MNEVGVGGGEKKTRGETDGLVLCTLERILLLLLCFLPLNSDGGNEL